MAQANQYEQQMLDLINADRTEAGLNPLAFNGDLNEASEDHSLWMLENDRFTHSGADGSSARERIEASGYELEGNWKTGENIAWVSEAGNNGLSDEVVRLHTNLMNSPEHRANLLNPAFEEIGIGIEAGDFVDGGQMLDAVFVTQNFGTTSANTVVAADADTGTPSPVNPTPVMVEDIPAADPNITAGTGFDFQEFMASRGFNTNRDAGENVMEATTSSSTTQTSTSSVEVTSVASEMDGTSVDVQGSGNFNGAGSATVDGVTAEAVDSGTLIIPTEDDPVVSNVADESQALQNDTGSASGTGGIEFSFDDFVFDFGPGTLMETGSTTSSASIRSVASSENGLLVEVLSMEGNVDLFGTASIDNETLSNAFVGSESSFSDFSMFSNLAFFEEHLF